MISLGLLGFPLSHSLSPKIHAEALKAMGREGEYRLYTIPPDDTKSFANLLGKVRDGEIQGLNVTIPHKQAVIPFLNELTSSAEGIGAVNTISLTNHRLIGQNTDAPGFMADLHRAFSKGFSQMSAIVLGAGGAARAVVYALLNEGWHVVLAVRKEDISQGAQLISSMKIQGVNTEITQVLMDSEGLLPMLKRSSLIVNATPVGMYPEIKNSPWPEGLKMPENAAVYDLVYNPRETTLIQQAKSAGLMTASGIGMLVEQAALSFEIWTGFSPPREILLAAAEAI
jgi:shikimate dehydrogenase